MARIPDDEVERLKQEVSLERLVVQQGIELRKHGKDLVGLCPFHDDREPSLVITSSKNLWHCLGACQTGGSVIDWVMRAQGVSFRLAVEMLRQEHPALAARIEPPRGGRPPADGQARKVAKQSSVQQLDSLAESEEPDAVVLRRVVNYYHETLKRSPEAQQYLIERGLQHGEVVEHFKLGFANRTLAYRLPKKTRKAGAALRTQLQRLGVLRESGHEHLNGSLTIPIFDAKGEVVELYGRKITSGLRKGTPKHLYLPGPHRGVWNRAALAASQEIILCESLIDALMFWCVGFRHVTAAYGVGGFTEDHWAAFREHGVQTVLIAYDRDDAGDKAAEKLARELDQEGIGSYRIRFPHGMDANAYARRVQPAAKALETVVRGATWMAGSAPRSGQWSVVSGQRSLRSSEHESETGAPSTAMASLADEPSVLAAEPSTDTQQGADDRAVVEKTGHSPRTTDHRDHEVLLRFGDRTWRIRGLGKNLSYERLKVNVLVARGERFHVDTLELYSSRQRLVFLKQAAVELELEERILKQDLGKVLLKLEALQDQQIKQALAPQAKRIELSEADKKAALALLRDPKLLERLLEDFARCGVVGEESNKLVGYLAALSRKLEEPLAVVIQSSSAAGKSSLMDAILSFVPPEERVQYSAMTGQSLFYMGETDLQHKILAIAEEEGAQSASYALKLLQSEGELTIASTGKDPQTGRLTTHEYQVQGPVMIFLTTTAVEVDEELLNRCLVLTVDEGRTQTQAIHARQRERHTLEGLLARQDSGRILKLHQDAQRLLRPLLVANPFAPELRFNDRQTRSRRDHMKYLTLIRSIALLYQYQRPVKEVQHQGAKLRYIEVDKSDIELADRLCACVLRRSTDELSPQARTLLGAIGQLVQQRSKALGIDRSDVRFTQRQLREHTGWSATQVKVQLRRLAELEYVSVHGHRDHRQRLLYGLVYDYDDDRSGFQVDRSGTGPDSESPVLSKDSGRVPQPVRISAGAVAGHGLNGTSYAQPAS